MSLAMRRRPAALTEQVQGEHVITVKNTFLEVSRVSPDCRPSSNDGLSTAPAALHAQGALRRSLLSAVGDSDCWEACQAVRVEQLYRTGCDASKGGASTPTTADSPLADTEQSTPSSEPPAEMWPPTPSSPMARVTISLAGLAGTPQSFAALQQGLESAAFLYSHEHWTPHPPTGDADAEWPVAHAEWSAEAAQWAGEATQWAVAGYEHAAMPPDCGSYDAGLSAPPEPPRFPPDFFLSQSASEPAPPSLPADGAIFPCVPNAPAPKCAPPSYAPQTIHSGFGLPSGPEWLAFAA